MKVETMTRSPLFDVTAQRFSGMDWPGAKVRGVRILTVNRVTILNSTHEFRPG